MVDDMTLATAVVIKEHRLIDAAQVPAMKASTAVKHGVTNRACRKTIALLNMEQRCRKCNRVLTTDESRQKGYGPVCDGIHTWVDLDHLMGKSRKGLMGRLVSRLKDMIPWRGT